MGREGERLMGGKGRAKGGGRIKISRQGQVEMLFGLSRGSTEQGELKSSEPTSSSSSRATHFLPPT